MVNNHLSSCNSHQISFELQQYITSHYGRILSSWLHLAFIYYSYIVQFSKKEVKSQPKHPWCKKCSGQELKRLGWKRCEAKASYILLMKLKFLIMMTRPQNVLFLRMFCGLVIIIKIFNFINSRRPWPPNLISHLFHPSLF